MAKSKQPGRQPDFILSVFDKQTEYKGRVGAAWLNEKGHISIKLNTCVVLRADENLMITLFPNDGQYESRRTGANQNLSEGPPNPEGGDDIPF